MTIKEFASLCGCNPQTLRYYDHVDLLKPMQVDQKSGYRYYDEEQALQFVRIRNLQTAGFTLDEIRGLKEADHDVIYDAFTAKIKEKEARLQKTIEIRQTYQNEITMMKEKLISMREMVRQSMEAYDPCEEFGIDRATYDRMIDSVNSYFEKLIDRKDSSSFAYSDYPDGDDAEEEEEFLNMLENPQYEKVYENHAWTHVKDFFAEFCKLEDGKEYALLFCLQPHKADQSAFATTVLGLLLEANPGTKRTLSCNVTLSKDGQNHFWLLRKKEQ